MKNLYYLLFILFCVTLNAQSYIKMEVITLKSGQEEEYLKIEEFFSDVKKLAVKKGLQSGWAVFKNIPNDQIKLKV